MKRVKPWGIDENFSFFFKISEWNKNVNGHMHFMDQSNEGFYLTKDFI